MAGSHDNEQVSGLEEWWARGELVELELDGAMRMVFVRRMGSGPHLTLLHGYPSSSHDWAKLAPALTREHTLLLLDFLGFGASEKPADHHYSLHEQADLVEALWAHEGVTRTRVLAHDYAVSVTQELLARRGEGSLAGGDRGRPPAQRRPLPGPAPATAGELALLDPEQGPRLSALINEELFVGSCTDLRRVLRRGAGQPGHLAGKQPRRGRADRPPPDPLHHRP